MVSLHLLQKKKKKDKNKITTRWQCKPAFNSNSITRISLTRLCNMTVSRSSIFGHVLRVKNRLHVYWKTRVNYQRMRPQNYLCSIGIAYI